MIQILLGVLAVSVLVGGVYVVRQETKMPPQVQPVVESSSATVAMAKDVSNESGETGDEMIKDEMVKDEKMEETMMKDESGDTMATSKPAPAAVATPAQYVPYTPEAVATYAARGDVVLFFRASWCPSCRALDADITSNLGSAPAGLTILDVNYDTATELRQLYGVTTQHTLVQVVADGTLIKKWSGGSTLASVIAQVE